MVRVDEDSWVAKAKRRKAYRDYCRKKFWDENGLVINATTWGQSGAPNKQRLHVVRLMNITRKGEILEDTHKEMVTRLALAVAASGLGAGPMGTISSPVVNLAETQMKALRDFFCSPAFFD